MQATEHLRVMISEAINARRMSASEIAERCGCSRQHVYKIMRGVQQPTLPLAERIAHALGGRIEVSSEKFLPR